MRALLLLVVIAGLCGCEKEIHEAAAPADVGALAAAQPSPAP